jgi:hypothetical protein
VQRDLDLVSHGIQMRSIALREKIHRLEQKLGLSLADSSQGTLRANLAYVLCHILSSVRSSWWCR